MRENVRFEFESASDARSFVIDILQEMQDNQGVSVDAFNKRLESFDKRLAFIEGEIKALKAREKEQEKEIVSLQKRVWALEPSEDDKKREQEQKQSGVSLKNYIKGELKSELLEFIEGKLAKETDGLKTTLAEYESGLKTPEVVEKKQRAKWGEGRGYKYTAATTKENRMAAKSFANKLFNKNKNELAKGGINYYYWDVLWKIRLKQAHIDKRTAFADIEWLLAITRRHGEHAIDFLKEAFQYHRQTGKQPIRRLTRIAINKDKSLFGRGDLND